jgi:dihydrofolate reductase
MKVILYMAATVNGIIAKNDDTADFLTPIESQSYVDHVIAAGALVIGRRTYEVLSQQPEFQKFLEAGVKIVAVSHEDIPLKDAAHRVAQSPKAALDLLGGAETVIVAGGGKLNGSFLSENLIDEMYIDIEPAVVGKGIPLFAESDADRSLKLLDTKQLSENEIQLHFAVQK